MSNQTLELSGLVLRYTVIRSSRRCKTLALKFISHTQLEVRAPSFISDTEIQHWLLQKRTYIKKKLAAIASSGTLKKALQYQAGEIHQYLGNSYSLSIEVLPSCLQSVFIKHNQLIITINNTDKNAIKMALYEWYRYQAKQIFQQRLLELISLTPWVKKVPLLKIRQMKTRWGSCSSEGNINLNLHLIKAPIQLIDYVILHELCHIAEFNHSPRFYQLMTQVCPNWRLYKRKLIEIDCNS